MSKELNVRKELWQKAHELEAKAFDANDPAAMNEAAEWKGKLTLAIMQENGTSEEPKEELQIPGSRPGNGALGRGLAAIMPKEDGGVKDGQV